MGNYSDPKLQTPEPVFIEYFSRISKVLNDLNLTYWLAFGTLLGYLRDGKHIKWDSDLDFGMPSEDYNILEKNKDLIRQQGFIIMDTKNPGKHKWRGMFIYDPKIKNFHIDISEWKLDKDSMRYTFRWYLRLNWPSKIFDYLYKVIEKEAKKSNDSKGIQVSDYSRYKRHTLVNIACKICFEIDYFFNTKRELHCYIPYTKHVTYYGIKTQIPCFPEDFTATNYGPHWRIPDSKFAHKGGSTCVRYKKKDGWEVCYVK